MAKLKGQAVWAAIALTLVALAVVSAVGPPGQSLSGTQGFPTHFAALVTGAMIHHDPEPPKLFDRWTLAAIAAVGLFVIYGALKTAGMIQQAPHPVPSPPQSPSRRKSPKRRLAIRLSSGRCCQSPRVRVFL